MANPNSKSHPTNAKVAVMLGGISAEREVSLMSGAGVLEALRSRDIDAHAFDPASQNLQTLKDQNFSSAFIALHGRGGEDGTLQGALEWLDIPYTGSGVRASALALDKIATKKIWMAMGLRTPNFVSLRADATKVERDAAFARMAKELGFPFIIKPPQEGSTLGLTKVKGPDQIQEGFDLCAKYDRTVLAEKFISGREFTVTILGGGSVVSEALPVIEIRAPEGNYDFQNKYYTDVTKYLCPAPISAELTSEIQFLARQAYDALGCEGWGRVDVLVEESSQLPFLLEVNTSPGMTSHSLVPIAAKAIGMSYEDLCLKILSTASLKSLGGKHVE